MVFWHGAHMISEFGSFSVCYNFKSIVSKLIFDYKLHCVIFCRINNSSRRCLVVLAS